VIAPISWAERASRLERLARLTDSERAEMIGAFEKRKRERRLFTAPGDTRPVEQMIDAAFRTAALHLRLPWVKTLRAEVLRIATSYWTMEASR